MFAGRCVCGRNRSQPSATVRNRPREDRMARMAVHIGSSAKGITFGAFQCRVASFRVAGVAFRGVSRRIKSRFVWQAQYFCFIFRRGVAFFVAGAALWTPPMSLCLAGAAL